MINKKLFSFILAFFSLTLSVFALPAPTKEFYVNDFANVIDENVEKHVLNTSAFLKKETGAQIVVVTVESLDGMDDSEYALNLGRDWGIGDKDKDNGFLMLISTSDRALRFEVGYGLEGALPDGKCGRIQDEFMIPYLSEDNYSDAVLNGYDAVVVEVCKEYGIEVPEDVKPVAPEDDLADIGSIIVAAVFLIIIFSIFAKRPPTSGGRHIFIGGFHGGFRGGGFGGSRGNGGFSGGGGSFGGGGSSRRF